jgi:hypothetical protein
VLSPRSLTTLLIVTFEAALTVLPPLALAGVLAAAGPPGGPAGRPEVSTSGPAPASRPAPGPRLASTPVRDTHIASTHGCTDLPFDPRGCTWNKAGVNGTVLLAGDSAAYAVADGVVLAATRLGMSTVVSARSGCPFLTLNSTGHKIYDCPSWQRQLLSYALDTRPDVVVIANRSSGYTRPESGWRTVIDTHGRVAKNGNAVSLYESALNDLVRRLSAAGIRSVVLQNAPEPAGQTSGTGSFSPAATIANRTVAALAESSVASAYPGTVLYDPIPVLCPTGICPLSTRGAKRYRDQWHLTREGSLLLTTSLAVAIHRADTRR